MFSLSAGRDIRSGVSATQQPQPGPSTPAKSSKKAARSSEQEVPVTMTSFPPFGSAEKAHRAKAKEHPDVVERSGAENDKVKPSKPSQQTGKKPPLIAKETGQEQAKSPQAASTSGLSPPPKNNPQPRRMSISLSLSHLRRPSKTQPAPDPRLRALGPMADGIAVDND